MNVPTTYWGDAVLTATYLINRLPSRILDNQSPIQCLNTIYPSSQVLHSLTPRIFGCTAFVHVHKPNRSKLDPRATKCVFLGYAPNKKGYKCFHPPTRRYFVSMDVTFHETTPYFTAQLQGETQSYFEAEKHSEPVPITHPLLPQNMNQDLNQIHNLPEDHHPETCPEINQNSEPNSEAILENSSPVIEPETASKKASSPKLAYQRRRKADSISQQHQSSQPEVNPINSQSQSLPSQDHWPIALRKGKRSCTQHPISNFVSINNLSLQHKNFLTIIESIRIPKSVQEALGDRNWTKAMNEEMEALEKNGT